jgi:hypothetical protein
MSKPNNKNTNIKIKTNKIKRTINRRVNAKIRSLRRTIRGINRRRNNNRIPAANTKSMNRDFKILYQDGNTVKVTGRDLVYKIPSDITDQEGTGIITVIPANPCYWLGTRIAALAQGYQNYRPLNMKFTYIPQCAVTQQGNVIAGTLWNQAPSNDNMQQSLRTSNGGQMSQCYKGFTSIVRLKSNLQYNLYKTAGQFDQESNPFLYIAMAVGCKQGEDHIIPGYFYVTWSFLLKNPIGNTNIFNNSGITDFKNVRENASYENKTIVFLTPDDPELQMGSIIQLEKDADDEIQAYYNGSYYDMADEDIVWYFSNSTIAASNANNKKYNLYYDAVYVKEQGKQQSNDPDFNAQYYIREDYEDPNYWYICANFETMGITLRDTDTAYYVENLKEAFDEKFFSNTFVGYLCGYDEKEGSLEPEEVDGWVFLVPKSMVNLKQYKDDSADRKARNKGIKEPQLPKTIKHDKRIKVVKEKPQTNQQPAPQQIKTLPVKHKRKPKPKEEEEYNEFSASELFQ